MKRRKRKPIVIPRCAIEVSEPFELGHGRLVRLVTTTHSDGFVCLNFDDVQNQGGNGGDECAPAGNDDTSF